MAISVVARGTGTANSSSITVTLPGTPASGQLMVIVLMAANVTPTTTWSQTSGTTGWTELVDSSALAVYYKQIGTSEANPSFDLSTSERSCYSVLAITGHADPASQAPQIAATTPTGTSNAPNPPSGATPPSSGEHLFIAAAGAEHGGIAFNTGSPTDYGNLNSVATGAAGNGAIVATAERLLTTSSAQNPGVFDMTGSQNWAAQTINVIVGATTYQRSATLTGTGDLAGSANKTAAGASALSGTGDLAGIANKTAAGAAALSGSGALAGTGARKRKGSSLMTGSGDLAGSANKTAAGASALSGTGIIAGTAHKTAAGVSALTGSGVIAGTANKTAAGASALTGTGDLVGAAVKTALRSAALTGVGDIVATGVKAGSTYQRAATLSGLATLTASAHKTAVGDAALTGTGALSGSGSSSGGGGGGAQGANAGTLNITGAVQ